MNPNRTVVVGIASSALFAVFATILAALPASAQDVVTVGTVTSSASTVDVPVDIRDVSGTPLGVDQPAGSKIQAYSFKVTYSPAAAVQSVTFSRAGITAGLTPTFESSPSSPGNATLIDSFSETTSPIPFTLNAAAPGNLVAHLVFTLSTSAAPGTSISLTLDPSLTDLSNQGGTTSESVANTKLTLVNGAINIPQLTIALAPPTLGVTVGGSSNLTATISKAVATDTTVTLGSSAPTIASVPASGMITAGQRTLTIPVSGVAIGTATITATLPMAAGGAHASSAVTVSAACVVPVAPVVTAPATAAAGAAYSVSWSSVSGATKYQIDEATNPSFTGMTSQSVTTTSVSFTHSNSTAMTYYYRVTAKNQGGSCNTASPASTTAMVMVAAATSQCVDPAVPIVTAPATAEAGTAYSVSWGSVSGATEYQIDEATDPTFATVTSETVTTTSASFTHSDSLTYYYRVFARNESGDCDNVSAASATVSVVVSSTPIKRIVPVVATTGGNFGANFKTSVQFYNPQTVSISGKIIFHTQGVSGTSSDPSLAYSILPGATLNYADLLPAMGIPNGLGSVDLVGDPGSSMPVSVIRVLNDAGADGTTGLTEEQEDASDALQSGETGALIAPVDIVKFRLNIGVRTLDQGAVMTIIVRDKDGVLDQTTTRTYGPNFFTQVASNVILDGFDLTGGETISFGLTSGSAFIYGATTDNTTNDPSVQFAHPID